MGARCQGDNSRHTRKRGARSARHLAAVRFFFPFSPHPPTHPTVHPPQSLGLLHLGRRSAGRHLRQRRPRRRQRVSRGLRSRVAARHSHVDCHRARSHHDECPAAPAPVHVAGGEDAAGGPHHCGAGEFGLGEKKRGKKGEREKRTPLTTHTIHPSPPHHPYPRAWTTAAT